MEVEMVSGDTPGVSAPADTQVANRQVREIHDTFHGKGR